MKPDYSAIFEALPDGESYLIEVVDFSETLSELYYEFPDTCYRIVERFAETMLISILSLIAAIASLSGGLGRGAICSHGN